MDGDIMYILGALLLAGTIVYMSLDERSRKIVSSKISRHKIPWVQTPRRSPSPAQNEKKNSANAASACYKDIFPPSRRFALADTVVPEVLGKDRREFSNSPSDSRTNLLPWAIPIQDVTSNAYTPMEISLEEIKALGDFPDYATLSGIPLPDPYREFDITKAIPRPYRPFRWAYHQTMSLTKMEHNWWIELENTYVERVKQRMGLYRDHGRQVLEALPGSEMACKELMEMVLQFMCARYPQYFWLDMENLIFHNNLLEDETDLKSVSPLEVLMRNCPEDFAIMLRNPDDGFYYLRAGNICSSLGWSLASKMGMQLYEIHDPIPDYKEKMRFSMDRYFAKKPSEKAIQRGSWGLEIDEPLFMPPGDPHEKHREVQHDDLSIDSCNLRVDWQTLRRLPLSGAIVFNFKAVFTPVKEFRDEPFVPALVLKVLQEGKKSIMEYKNTWHTEHRVIPALERYAREQVENGLVPKDWEPHTLEESPWFPGWEEKWHRQQGF